jgi:cytochrome c2/Tfp pilus assembly protein PilV
MREYRVTRMKLLLLAASVVCLVYLFLAAYQENLTAQWRESQRQYAVVLAEQAKAKGKTAREYPVKLRQVYLADWGIVDRCVNCHVGIDNPTMKGQPQPLAAHSGDWLKHHPPERLGCTVCHQGQGRATDKDAAHGRVPFWSEPLLTGDFVQATCGKCHQGDEIPAAPVWNRGRRLIVDLGCVGCHKVGEIQPTDKVGPPLTTIGSKVTRRWLEKWLANPKGYLPHAKMPNFNPRASEVAALAGYLLTFRDPAIDNMVVPKGNYDAGANLYREGQCIVCHVTMEDYAGNPLGGSVGPDVRKLGNKLNANRKWLVAFLKNPHALVPQTKMPRYNFTDQQAADLADYAYTEWVDADLADAEKKLPEPPATTPEQIAAGKRLFSELDCTGCHDLTASDKRPDAPDLTSIGNTPLHLLTFGDAPIRHTRPDYLFTKLQHPRSLHHAFRLPPGETPSEAIWQGLRPMAMFSAAEKLPDRPEGERLAWILQQAQQAGALEGALKLPSGNARAQAEWLVRRLNESGALNPLKMPNFQLVDEDAAALTIVLMSLSEASAPSRRFEVRPQPKAIFNPHDDFGQLVHRYRCTSCHKIRDSGDLLAADLTWEGSRARREWLYHYLNRPYSMRRTITIAMPIFHFPDKESRFMADYMSLVFVDADMGAGWKNGQNKADAARGEQLFQDKGCMACHQLHQKGGDVGPSLTTQVPEFPMGTWVGDKLRPEWIYQWLKNPQTLLPDTIEPNLGLSEQELLDLTAYLSNLKNPDFQKKQPKSAPQKP